MSEPVIVAQRLTRYFGKRAAVQELSLELPRGCVLGFLGRNGSGKTTTIRMLLGLLEPTRGSARLFGHDARALPPEVRARVGYMAEAHPVYGWMSPRQAASFQKRFFPRWNQRLFEAIVAHFHIDPRSTAGHLSRGQRAGLSLALTLAPEPELLILDDPALGLDPVARRSLLEAMLYFTRRHDRTIFFSSHILSDIERVADHLAILDQSVLRACCPVEVFRERVQEIVLRFPGAGAPPPLPVLAGLLRALRFPGEWRLTVANAQDKAATLAATLAATHVEVRPLSLEDQVLAYMDVHGEQSFLLDQAGEQP